jgi:hypothetical protein
VAAGRIAAPVTVVLEGAARAAAAGATRAGGASGLNVVAAPGSGDDAIVAAVAGAGPAGDVTVVTADRGLRDRVQGLGAAVVGPRWLLDRLGSDPA